MPTGGVRTLRTLSTEKSNLELTNFLDAIVKKKLTLPWVRPGVQLQNMTNYLANCPRLLITLA